MLRHLYLIIILLITSSPLIAEDSIPPQKKGVIGVLYDFVKEFSRVDTNYVEPQRYNFAAMIQNTNTYEVYRLSSSDGMNVVFAPCCLPRMCRQASTRSMISLSAFC